MGMHDKCKMNNCYENPCEECILIKQLCESEVFETKPAGFVPAFLSSSCCSTCDGYGYLDNNGVTIECSACAGTGYDNDIIEPDLDDLNRGLEIE